MEKQPYTNQEFNISCKKDLTYNDKLISTPNQSPKRVIQPPAPRRLSSKEALINTFFHIFAEADFYVEEDKVLNELLEKHIYYPSLVDIETVMTKYKIAPKNRCLECHIDMGIQNPRQLCGRIRCVHR
jgi:hypothetical protein